ncbi:MAG: 16S rRNA (adenine(1518)-N(6)/adenine(1519)-N(6))-dimethyltransferase RsmA [bacterium]
MKKDKPRTSALQPSAFSPQPSSLPPPSKKLGQNFLVNEGVVKNIVDALAPERNETIIEIGPGRGALTAQLVNRAERVVAVEFDRNLIPHLTDRFNGNRNLKLVPADALNVDFCLEIQPADSARVVANLPYNVATAILQRLIAQRRCLTEMVLMLQREVVARIIAPPDTKERGYLSVFVQFYCETEKLFDVAPGSFRPAPKVWSSVVRLVLRSRPAVTVQDEDLLWKLVSVGFAQRRKTILNNMRSGPPDFEGLMKRHGGASIVLCRAEVELQRRAETLTLEEWARIVRALE